MTKITRWPSPYTGQALLCSVLYPNTSKIIAKKSDKTVMISFILSN